MIVREEQAHDHSSVSKITYDAFCGLYERMKWTHPVTEHKIIEKLRESGEMALSLVAEVDKEVAGHVAFSKVTIDGKDVNWYALGPVSVRVDLQRRGIGTELIKTGLARVRDLGARGVVLVGDPNFYKRFGFIQNDSLVVENTPPEFVLSLAFAEPTPSGNVTFGSSFGLH